MSDFSFLAVSNVQGMRFLRYIKVFGIGILFGVCLFFLIYFIIVYRRKKSASKQAHRYNEKVLILEQELCIQNIMKASEKLKVSLFIEYLEKFVTTASYANISELLVSQ
jgi:flagellar biosynthesis/type III secretory pathway M-ring protein FliF/YscJ